MSVPSIVVVGGGIAGLAAAWELTGGADGPNENTPRVEVIEAQDRFGGALLAEDFAGRHLDLGPDGFLARRPEAVGLIREMGLGDQLVGIDASGASIYLGGRLSAIPTGLVLGVPTAARQLRGVHGLSWRAHLAARRDEWLPRRLVVDDRTTIGSILRGKLGRELTYQFIEPMVGGIQAGRVDDLDAKSVFPGLLQAAKRGGSLMRALRPASASPATADPGPLFCTLAGGVGSLPGALVERLRERGVVLRPATAVSALRRTPSSPYPLSVDTATTTTPANSVVLATPAAVAGRLLGEGAASALRDVPCAGAAMVIFVVASDALTLPATGTGVLVPLQTPWPDGGSLLVTAITFLDRKWPHLRREGEVVLRAHVGRIDDERWRDFDDRALSERVRAELAMILGRFGAPTHTRVQRWPEGLPQYYPGHDDMVASARAAAAAVGVTLAGNAYDGVGIPAAIGSGRRAAREALAAL